MFEGVKNIGSALLSGVKAIPSALGKAWNGAKNWVTDKFNFYSGIARGRSDAYMRAQNDLANYGNRPAMDQVMYAHERTSDGVQLARDLQGWKGPLYDRTYKAEMKDYKAKESAIRLADALKNLKN